MNNQDLDAIQLALHELRRGELGVHAFSSQVRSHDRLLRDLPPQYGRTLFDTLDRLESSALFTEESSSLSQSTLLDAVQRWIEQARAQLAAPKS